MRNRNEEENNIQTDSQFVNNNNEINNINNRSKLFQSTIAQDNPIVIQLTEFGYDPIYSRRVFHYLHPQNLDEALNYMAINNGIIQHRFVRNNRNTISDDLCYICFEERERHLGESNIRNNFVQNGQHKNNIEIKINNINSIPNNVNIENDLKISVNSNLDKNLNINRITKIQSEKNSSFGESKNDFSFSSKNSEIKNKIIKINKNNDEKIEIKDDCEICGDKYIINKKNKVEKCGHSFCEGCWFDFLSVKINENQLPSIKCLNYECKEKLSDEFIINLLNFDFNLIRKYKKYKLELEIINDPNKKMCPYPNCNSYLELKQIRNKDVTCLNNHTYCFICLKKPHGKLPCNKDIDSEIREYAQNNFVKKCPKCSIITEKNSGCNHITCTKCQHQWCWLCNEKYTQNHYKEGKCKGFQFFQPKNDYDIKLVMEGKINSNELSNSQRQFDMQPFEEDDFPRDRPLRGMHRHHHFDDDEFYFPRRRPRFMNEEERIERDYNELSVCKKIRRILLYIFFGHIYHITNCIRRLPTFIIYAIYFLFNLVFSFHLILINIIMFIPILLAFGFKKLIVGKLNRYIRNFILVIFYLFMGQFIIILIKWKTKIEDCSFSNGIKILLITLIIFPCLFMTLIILFPCRLFCNIIFIIILLLYDGNFREFYSGISEAFGFEFED